MQSNIKYSQKMNDDYLDISESHDDVFSNISTSRLTVTNILKKIEKGSSLSLEDAWKLLNIDPTNNSELFSDIIESSRKIKSGIFHNEVYPIVPLYVSSICQEHCSYCNYRAENKDKEIQRVRLSNKELETEAEFLVNKGLRVIELVYATDPFITVDDICEHIQTTRATLSHVNGIIGLNARSYTIEDYRKLKESGLDFVVLWQETYNPARYMECHAGNSEKGDYFFRLGAPERMLQAGIANIGMGILSGLSDWRKDWYTLMKHVTYLVKKYNESINSIILGIPRLKPVAGAVMPGTTFIPTDEEYLLAISVFNLFLPSALPFVNTRESWNMCLEIAYGGGTLFTFNCKTIPGGYTLARLGHQFPTYDYDVKKYAAKLLRRGLKPIYDWDLNRTMM